jgi:hypothetical protein
VSIDDSINLFKAQLAEECLLCAGLLGVSRCARQTQTVVAFDKSLECAMVVKHEGVSFVKDEQSFATKLKAHTNVEMDFVNTVGNNQELLEIITVSVHQVFVRVDYMDLFSKVGPRSHHCHGYQDARLARVWRGVQEYPLTVMRESSEGILCYSLLQLVGPNYGFKHNAVVVFVCCGHVHTKLMYLPELASQQANVCLYRFNISNQHRWLEFFSDS